MMVEKPLLPKRVRNPWLRLARYWYLKIRRQEGTPEAIARGWACGVFAGSFPLFGLQTLVGLLFATIFHGNKLTAVAGTWISNPLTYLPIFYFNFRVGEVVLQRQATLSEAQLQSFSEMGLAGIGLLSILFTGCFVVGTTLAIFAYLASLALINRWRSLRHKDDSSYPKR